jgi:hypothetical protein
MEQNNVVPKKPMLDSKELQALENITNMDSNILEYGAGGSTFFLAKRCKQLVTVESDKNFLSAISRSNQGTSNIIYLHGDIGRTKSFGQPLRIFRWKNVQKYPSYPLSPWSSEKCPRNYSGIFIDGRFRVSCALATLIFNKEGDYQILIDDYFTRPEYSVVEQLIEKPIRHGNAALFHVYRNRIDFKLARELFDMYKYDFN